MASRLSRVHLKSYSKVKDTIPEPSIGDVSPQRIQQSRFDRNRETNNNNSIETGSDGKTEQTGYSCLRSVAAKTGGVVTHSMSPSQTFLKLRTQNQARVQATDALLSK